MVVIVAANNEEDPIKKYEDAKTVTTVRNSQFSNS